MTPVLEASGLHAGYGPVTVLHGVDFEVGAGEVVVVLGANGAGKTTMLRAICQAVKTTGRLLMDGTSLSGRSTTQVIRSGVAHVIQGRGTFAELTVEENLQVGAFRRRDREIDDDMQHWYSVFPRLAERRAQHAGSLSGGEQQMLAIARALMSRPRVLLLDEPSLGLAPLVTKELFDRLGALNASTGLTMLIVEQNAHLAFDIGDRAYVLETGRVVASGPTSELRLNDAVQRAYLGQ